MKEPSEDLAKFFGRKRNLAERRFDPLKDLEMTKGAKAGSLKKEKRKVGTLDDRRNRCPIVGAPDPLSHNPMARPMMDENGFVMDLESWRKVLEDGEAPPCPLVVQSEKDLVEVTAGNFEDLKLWIVNVPC